MTDLVPLVPTATEEQGRAGDVLGQGDDSNTARGAACPLLSSPVDLTAKPYGSDERVSVRTLEAARRVVGHIAEHPAMWADPWVCAALRDVRATLANAERRRAGSRWDTAPEPNYLGQGTDPTAPHHPGCATPTRPGPTGGESE